MYSILDLLQMLYVEKADALKLRVNQPPALLFEGDHIFVEGPTITAEEMMALLHSIADSRQRRTLRERGELNFVFRFQDRVDFVVRVRLEDEMVAIDIH